MIQNISISNSIFTITLLHIWTNRYLHTTHIVMAQSKLNDLAGKFGKGGPPGLGIGLKVLAFGGAAIYGISQSMYTGMFVGTHNLKMWISLPLHQPICVRCAFLLYNVILFLTQLRVVIVQSSLIVWVASKKKSTQKDYISAFHGLSIPSSMTFVRVPEKSPHQPVRKICKWSTFRCVSCPDRIRWICQQCIANLASTMTRKYCRQFVMKC